MAARGGSKLTIFASKLNCLQRFAFSEGANVGKTFDKRLLDILVCPLSKEPLRYDEENNELVNEKLNVAYSIQDGIPNMNPRNARIISEAAEE